MPAARCGRARRGARCPTTSRAAPAPRAASTGRAGGAQRRQPGAEAERHRRRAANQVRARQAEAERGHVRVGRASQNIHGTTRSRSCSSRFGPIPGTASSSSTELEGAVLLAVVEDFLRGHGPDAGQRVELLERRRAELHRARPALRGGGARSGRRAARAPPGHDDLLPVGERRGEVHLREVGLGSGPARAGEGVRDPRALREPVQARPAHGSDDVHHHPRGRQPGHARAIAGGGGRGAAVVVVPAPRTKRPRSRIRASEPAAARRSRRRWRRNSGMRRACPSNRHACVPSCRKCAEIGTQSAHCDTLLRASAGTVPNPLPPRGAREQDTVRARARPLDDQVDELPRHDDRLPDLLAVQVRLHLRRGLRPLDQLLLGLAHRRLHPVAHAAVHLQHQLEGLALQQRLVGDRPRLLPQPLVPRASTTAPRRCAARTAGSARPRSRPRNARPAPTDRAPAR